MEKHVSPPPFQSPVLESILEVFSTVTTELSDAQTVSRMGGVRPLEYQSFSVSVRNACVIEMVRNAHRADGYFAGWSWLATLCSKITLPTALVADALTCIRVYASLLPRAAPQRLVPTPFFMLITRGNFQDSLFHVGPKSIGGKAWASSEEYLSVHSMWSNTGFGLLSPCTTFAWLSPQRKIIAREELDDCDSMALLGTVEFDYDRVETYGVGFSEGLEIARLHLTAIGTRMQGYALAALLNYDMQKYVRRHQEAWIAEGRGAPNAGPQAISAADWVDTYVADSTCISSHGYEPAALYTKTKVGAFVTLMLCNTYDVLYDVATSNPISSAIYAAAAGITDANLHCIFVTSYVDGAAQRICQAPNGEYLLFGDNALLSIAAWAGFSDRYRTWERFVKYSRQIARSSSMKAVNIAEHAVQQLILPDCNLVDISDSWDKLTRNASTHATTPRLTAPYHLSAAPELMAVPLPDICSRCMGPFQQALDAFSSDRVLGVEGLPAGVTECRAVALAAGIRRVAIFATSERCCDVCACRIGCWADLTSYRVLTALMADEKSAASAHWLLQCYAVWAVTEFPVSVATVLSGFDFCCEAIQDKGAMGVRDVLDC
ncbi:hypothetical protein DFH08DRAFT_1077067 [Mycena albidolilacea]|uniref:Uncharacterized protein n=1 Tax=Mycena albidolilacea TaxID=1033008 RepID=A0AAD7ABI0_9AGAR|nr:hypothetical protein DFH08DRAFT_1077067 [Mycena albidolilacea]